MNCQSTIAHIHTYARTHARICIHTHTHTYTHTHRWSLPHVSVSFLARGMLLLEALDLGHLQSVNTLPTPRYVWIKFLMLAWHTLTVEIVLVFRLKCSGWPSLFFEVLCWRTQWELPKVYWEWKCACLCASGQCWRLSQQNLLSISRMQQLRKTPPSNTHGKIGSLENSYPTCREVWQLSASRVRLIVF